MAEGDEVRFGHVLAKMEAGVRKDPAAQCRTDFGVMESWNGGREREIGRACCRSRSHT